MGFFKRCKRKILFLKKMQKENIVFKKDVKGKYGF